MLKIFNLNTESSVFNWTQLSNYQQPCSKLDKSRVSPLYSGTSIDNHSCRWLTYTRPSPLHAPTDTPHIKQQVHPGRSSFAEVGIEYTHGQLYMLIQGRRFETLNLITSSMNTPPPVLSPSSILPPLSSHCAFILASREIRGAIPKICLNFRFYNYVPWMCVSRGVPLCTYTHLHTRFNTFLPTYLHAYWWIYTYINIHTCIYLLNCTYILAYVVFFAQQNACELHRLDRVLKHPRRRSWGNI
jgi:hypothetical protein